MSFLARLWRRSARDSGLIVEPLRGERGFAMRGDLDISSVETARSVLESLEGTLVLDLSGIGFIDDSGLGFLVATLKRLGRGGGSLVIRAPSAPVRRVLEITGLVRARGLVIEP